MAHMKEKEKEKETQSHIKLIIKLHATSSSMPRKQLVLYLPRSPKQKRDPSEPSSSDTRCNKRCKVVASHIEYSSVSKTETATTIIAKDSRTVHDHEISAYPTKSGGTADKCGGVVKEKSRISKTGCEDKEKKKTLTMRVVTKDSRILSKEKCEKKEGVNNSCSKKMKMRKVATDKVSEINTDQYPTKPSTKCCGVVKEKGRVGYRISRSGSEEECKLKEKNNKEEKNARVVPLIDHCKKMQCWVMLKRLMTGRDSWVFKQPMMGLEILDNNYSVVDHHHESKSVSKPFIKSVVVCNETTMKPSDLKDIESKLKNCLYTEPDEFADDIRVIFSYGLLHPPRNEIYKITRRLSEDFELNWKSLKDKWSSEERKGRKNI